MRTTLLLLVFALVMGCTYYRFRSALVASATGDGKYWILTQPLEYEQPKTKQKFVVPRGFVTDLASVPRLFWTAFPPCGNYTPAAVVHDYLYWEQLPSCNRECADTVLLVAMEESGVGKLARNAIYAGVRVGGEGPWKKNAADKAAGHIRQVPEEFMNFGPYDTWQQIEARILAKR